MNNITIPINGNHRQQKQQLQSIKDAMAQAMMTHPGMAEIIAQDPSMAQLQIIYLEASSRLQSVELMEAMTS